MVPCSMRHVIDPFMLMGRVFAFRIAWDLRLLDMFSLSLFSLFWGCVTSVLRFNFGVQYLLRSLADTNIDSQLD